MNDNFSSTAIQPGVFAVFLLVAASMSLSLGFACAVPLAAFAAISASLLPGAAAYAAIVAVWLANQFVGFAWLHYPMDAGTLAWGAALGVIAVGCVGVARAVLARFSGMPASGLAFVAAFAVYESAIYATCLVSGTELSHVTVAIVTRVFLINGATLVGFLALWALVRRTETGRRFDASLGLRHA